MIGVTLGMLGSGGSAITIPILVYVIGHDAKQAITESMAIVGLISVASVIPYARIGGVNWRAALMFGLPSLPATYCGAVLGGAVSATLQLIVFSIVLFVVAFAMLWGTKTKKDVQAEKPKKEAAATWKMILSALMVGLITGFVGVGGGFLIVPALVVMIGLSMREAIGTSLVIIAANCAIGFVKYERILVSLGESIDTSTIMVFVVIGVFGSFVGRRLNHRLNQKLLKQVFGVFLILLGGFVIVRESYSLFF